MFAQLRRAALIVDELAAVARMAGARAALRFGAAVLRSAPAVLRARNLSPADALMSGSWRVRAGQHDVAIDGRHWAGAREMYGRRVYLPNPGFVIRPGERAVDLGANVGLFSLWAAVHGARVLAVEAQHGFVDEITTNLAANGVADQVAIVTALVGAGTGTFARPEDVLRGDRARGVPPVVELGALLDAHGFDVVDFLKVDIEGSEFALFAAPESWLPRVRRIAMEVHPAHGSVAELVALLAKSGFQVDVTDDRGHPTAAPPERGGYVYARRA